VQSLPTLRRRLASCDLGVVDVFGLWPSRLQFDEILPLQDGAPLALPGEARPWRQRLRRKGFFLPAHSLIAQAGGRRRLSSYDRICAAIAHDLAAAGKDPVRPLRYLMTRKDKMIIRAARGSEDLVVRVPFGAAAVAAEARHAAALARLAVSHPSLAPEFLAAGRIDGFDYQVETALPGAPLRRAILQRRSPEILDRVEQLLEVMNPAGSLVHAPLEDAAYARLIEARLDRLDQLVRDPDQQRRLRGFFRGRLYGARLPIGLVHGDFSASNIFIAGDRTGIVDWEAAAYDDLPILDAIGYLESILRPFSPRRSLAEGFHALAQRNFPSAAEERFLFARYERLDIDSSHHVGLVYLRWLRQIDYLSPYWLSYDPGGQERYVHQVVQLLLSDDAASRE
jgi:aminoglycoside phosphotransferase (APT) family kinase protein